MADTTNTSQTTSSLGFSQYNQIDIKDVSLYREGWSESQKIKITSIIEEVNIYEDCVESPTVTVSMLISDPVNITDSLPIIGGERVSITYRTPTLVDYNIMEFVVYKTGHRVIDKENQRSQKYILYLCTLDRYVDSYTDVSQAFTGSYGDIITSSMNILKSTKSLNIDSINKCNGVQSFVAPYWSPLKICQWCAKRSIGTNYEPFLFYETLDGYSYSSLKTLYSQTPYTKFFIEPKKTQGMQTDIQKQFRTVVDFEYLESNDKLIQNAEGIFGATVYRLNVSAQTISKSNYDYTTMFKLPQAVMMEKYELYDDVASLRTKGKFILSRADNSDLGLYYRKMLFGLMGTYRIRIMVPGDSAIRAGMMVNLDIPARRTTMDNAEQLTSGKWFVKSLRHILKRNAYFTILELCKDSYPIDVTKQINGN